MKRYVVDTNVPIVANGLPDPSRGAQQPSAACRLAAIDFLEALLNEGRVVLDAAGEVEAEYRRHLNPKRQPNIGDRFYLELLRGAAQRVERMALPKTPDGAFADFPNDPELRRFDTSDRKFAALALRAGAPVAIATDSDWLDFQTPLTRHGVKLDFLCGARREAWFKR